MKHTNLLFSLLCCAFSPSAMSIPCDEPPEDAVEMVFRVLENQGRDQAVVADLYQREFSNEFKRTFSFVQFYSQIRDVQRNLRIGIEQNRSWESRGLGGGGAIVEPIRGSTPAFHVQFLTTSPVGKIGQRAYVICEKGDWKLTGLWYFPLANSGQSTAGKGLPQYCCTAVGKLGPYANPDSRTGRQVNEGEACFGTASSGSPSTGKACY